MDKKAIFDRESNRDPSRGVIEFTSSNESGHSGAPRRCGRNDHSHLFDAMPAKPGRKAGIFSTVHIIRATAMYNLSFLTLKIWLPPIFYPVYPVHPVCFLLHLSRCPDTYESKHQRRSPCQLLSLF